MNHIWERNKSSVLTEPVLTGVYRDYEGAFFGRVLAMRSEPINSLKCVWVFPGKGDTYLSFILKMCNVWNSLRRSLVSRLSH